MATLLSEIYDVTLKRGNRGQALSGYYRPTLSEFFMTDHDYVRSSPRYSNNLCIGGTATASSNTTGTYSVYHAFPVIKSSLDWRAGAADIAWAQYQFPTAYAITKIAITAADNYAEKAPTAFTIKASNTGTFTGEETLLATFNLTTDWTNGEKREFEFLNRTEFLYYKITMTDKLESFGKTYEYIINRFEMFARNQVTYSDNLCTNAVAYSASYNSTGDFGVNNLLDDDDTSMWYGGTEDTAWIQFNFSNPEKVEQLILGAAPTALTRAPKTFTLKGSNVGTFTGEETTVLTIDNAGAYDEYLLGKIFNFTNNNSYSYYRLNITDKDGAFGVSNEYIMSKMELNKILD